MKKPVFGKDPDLVKVAEAVSLMIGRGKHDAKITLPALNATTVSAAPTADQYNALLNDLINLRNKVQALLDRLQD